MGVSHKKNVILSPYISSFQNAQEDRFSNYFRLSELNVHNDFNGAKEIRHKTCLERHQCVAVTKKAFPVTSPLQFRNATWSVKVERVSDRFGLFLLGLLRK